MPGSLRTAPRGICRQPQKHLGTLPLGQGPPPLAQQEPTPPHSRAIATQWGLGLGTTAPNAGPSFLPGGRDGGNTGGRARSKFSRQGVRPGRGKPSPRKNVSLGAEGETEAGPEMVPLWSGRGQEGKLYRHGGTWPNYNGFTSRLIHSYLWNENSISFDKDQPSTRITKPFPENGTVSFYKNRVFGGVSQEPGRVVSGGDHQA